MLKDKPELKNIPIHQLSRGRYQPRRDFEPNALQELADSIRSSGLIQPIVVRPLNVNHYGIVAGERRWRAAQLAGLDSVQCLVKCYSDEQSAAVSTIENINRVNLNPIEEALAYQRLITEFSYLHEEVAAVVGKSRVKITNSLRLLKLDSAVQSFLIDGSLSEGHGKVLAGLALSLQLPLAKQCVQKGWNVRRLEQEAKRLQMVEVTGDAGIDPNLLKLANALSDHVGCKVAIDFQHPKGQLKIDFHNLEILEGILERLGFQSDPLA